MLHLALTLAGGLMAADTTLTIRPGVELELVRIPAGSFVRDVPEFGEQTVTLSRDYWMGKYEVTWEVWTALMGWDDGRGQPGHPARRLTWIQARDFLDRLSDAVDGWTFRLPTEAEWEYAARGGDHPTGERPATVDVSTWRDEAWTRENAGGVIQPVGTRLPNRLGLHDMRGNVWEWVQDWMGPYPARPALVDPSGPADGTERVRRGGSAVYTAAAADPGNRYQLRPDAGNGNLGFRVVATPTEAAAGEVSPATQTTSVPPGAPDR